MTGHVPKRRRRRFLPALALLPLAACGGAGEDVAGPLHPILAALGAAPAALDPGVLTRGFAGALAPGVQAAADALLSTSRYDRQRSPSWFTTLYSGATVSGLSSQPLRTSGAAFAHAAGLTGAGSTIAVADYRLDTTHPVLGGTPLAIDSNRTASQPPGWSDDAWRWHGTAVASVLAGDSADFVGVAPDAGLLFGSYATTAELAALTHRAADAGAVAFNNSWGYPSLGVNAADFSLVFSGDAGAAWLAALDRYAAQGVVVFALPNDDTLGRASLMDGLPYLRPSLEAGWLAAGNAVPTMAGDRVSGVRMISGGCWEAARWCLLADGAWEAADPTAASGFRFVTGASFAAPQVSGALALLQQAFPDLDPHALRVRLLASADDGFFTPDATVELAEGFTKGFSLRYGHGFLDIEAALKPIGPTAMVTASGEALRADAPILVAGSAMGDAVARSLAGTTVRVTDALDAGFAVDAGALAAAAAPRPQAAALMVKGLAADLARERRKDGPVADPFAAFAGTTLALDGPDGRTRAALLLPPSGSGSAGLSLSGSLGEGPLRLDLGLTVGRDGGGTLGFAGTAAGDDGAMMAAVSLGVTGDLGGGAWLALSGEAGVTDLGGDTALGRTSGGRFDSARIELGAGDVFARGDRLTFSLGLPTAVTGGSVSARLPVITAAGMGFETRRIDLAPEARQVDIGLSYQTEIAPGAELKMSVIGSENFGNIEGRRDRGAALALTWRF